MWSIKIVNICKSLWYRHFNLTNNIHSMREVIFDIETDGLENYTKIHCLSYTFVGEWKLHTTFDYNEMKELFSHDYKFIGHFISNYDCPVLTDILGINFKDKWVLDTLFLAQYVFQRRNNYSLESFGERYGVEKVKVSKDKWDSEDTPEFRELMKVRCETDVKINSNLYKDMQVILERLYDGEAETKDRLVNYFSFKAKLAYLEIQNPCYIDTDSAVDLLIQLAEIREEKVKLLRTVMPSKSVYTTKHKPKKMFNVKGELTSLGVKWNKFLEDNKVDPNTDAVRYISSYEEANPRSDDQKKAWLYSFGWEPCTYRYERNKETNEVKRIPQILNEDKELTPSVEALLEKEPLIIELEGLGMLSHRIDTVTAIIMNSLNTGTIGQELKGIASTFRYKHGKLVNIPSIQKPWGSELRSLLIAPEGYKVIGVDIKNLESRTRDHFIMSYDPKYVEEMSQEGFDSHLDICVHAGILTPEQAEAHKRGDEDYSKERKKGKIVNFSSVYNVGAKTLARTLGSSISYAEKLLLGYWKRNHSVKSFAKDQEVKSFDGFMWIKSPLNGYWLHLRKDNDRFSAVNQNAGVTVFDTWVAYLYQFGIIINFQMHDEIMFYVKDDEVDKVIQILNKSCKYMNNKLKLNVTIGIDTNVGDKYSQIH